MAPEKYVNTDRLVQTFLNLVRIDSPSRQEKQISDHLKHILEGYGCSVVQDDLGNLVAELPGQGEETILLSAHMDTVGSDTGITPVIRDGVIYSDGSTILGADDKSGVAVILEALEVLKNHPELPHAPLEIAFSVSEEIGLVGSKALDKSLLKADWGLIFDSGGPIGVIVYTAPYQDSVQAEVRGKKAHAGGEPEKGVNAIVIASEAIVHMPLGRIDVETTSNIGIIKGGNATNIVPDYVFVKGEARSRDEKKLQAQTRAMVKAFENAAQKHHGAVDIEVVRKYPGYKLDFTARPYVAAARALDALGMTVIAKASGGGTDGNIYNQAGIPCVALSTGMTAVHTQDEHIAIQDMVDAARVLVTIITQEATQ